MQQHTRNPPLSQPCARRLKPWMDAQLSFSPAATLVSFLRTTWKSQLAVRIPSRNRPSQESWLIAEQKKSLVLFRMRADELLMLYAPWSCWTHLYRLGQWWLFTTLVCLLLNFVEIIPGKGGNDAELKLTVDNRLWANSCTWWRSSTRRYSTTPWVGAWSRKHAVRGDHRYGGECTWRYKGA